MAMLRVAKCDICKEQSIEKVYGAGWPGWAILNGIAAEKPKEGESLTEENMSMIVCPEHKNIIANFITTLQEE